MLLKKIRLNNIRSYNDQEIEFPSGSILLSGDIGSGKTSVLLAIEFALFGLQPGQRGASLLRNGTKEGSVVLEFDIGENNIIIERGLKKGKTISQDYASITINGEKQEMSITELKNKVLEILNYPLEFVKKTNLLYRFTVYTPQEEMKKIILQDPKTRLNTLRHVFGIDKYKTISENTIFLTQKLREQTREKQAMIQDMDTKKESLKQKKLNIESIKKEISNIEKDFSKSIENRKQIESKLDSIKEKINEKENYEKEIEKTKIMFSSKKDLISKYSQDIESLKTQIQEISKISFDPVEINRLEAELEDYKKRVEIINEENIDITAELASLRSRIEESQNTKLNISTIDSCPTCLQSINDNYRTNILLKIDEEINKNNKKVNQLLEDKQKALKNIDELKSSIKLFEKQISDLKILKIKLESMNEKKQRIEQLEKQKQLLENDLKMLNKHIDDLKKSVFDLSKFDKIFEIENKNFDEALKKEKMIEIKMAELKKELDLSKKQICEIEDEIKEKEKIKDKLNHIKEIEGWISNNFLNLIYFIEKNVMLKLKEEFSKLFNEWFTILVQDTLTVRLDEEFTPIIEQQDYELDYSYLSGGERTAIALAYRLALNQVINSMLSRIKTNDLVILDEPTDGFSDQQLDKIRDILDELNVQQLILVSHEQKIESFVENIIRFKKEDNTIIVEV